MLLFYNKKSEPLAKEVAEGIRYAEAPMEKKTFPDGEIYVRLLCSVKGEEVLLIHTTQNNDDLVELILTLSALKDNNAKRITCIIPHLLYQRQDTAFLEGEAVSARAVLKIIDSLADEIYTVNAHFFEKRGKQDFFGVNVDNLDAFPLLGRYFAKTEDLLIVSPDEGSKGYAKAAADAVGCKYDYLIKRRLDGENVEMQPKELDVRGKNVLILDDIIATGGTMVKASVQLRAQGAQSVHIGCVHGVFSKGIDVFKGVDVFCTDTIPSKLTKVSVAPLIIEALKR